MDWRKSSHSGSNGSCVETATGEGVILVRDTTDRDSATLAFTAQAWAQFTASLRLTTSRANQKPPARGSRWLPPFPGSIGSLVSRRSCRIMPHPEREVRIGGGRLVWGAGISSAAISADERIFPAVDGLTADDVPRLALPREGRDTCGYGHPTVGARKLALPMGTTSSFRVAGRMGNGGSGLRGPRAARRVAAGSGLGGMRRVGSRRATGSGRCAGGWPSRCVAAEPGCGAGRRPGGRSRR
jgi:hypothetical protein